MPTSTDMFVVAIANLERPFPEKVCIASHYGLPIFNTGMAHWHIVDAAGSGDVICSMMFPAPAISDDRMAKKYLAAVEARAETLAKLINSGLEAQQS